MHERIIGLYEDNAAEWDRVRGRRPEGESDKRRFMEKAWLDRFLASLPAGGTVLDIGCGTGEPIARYVIERGYRVVGVDSSPSMIAIASRRLPGQEWVAADMRTLDLGRQADGLIAWHSFFHLSPADQRPMFARFAAHAAPGAMLMFTSGTEHGEAIGEWMGEPLYHASLDTAEYRALLVGNGFDVVDHRIDDPDCGADSVWLARRGSSGLS